jgi:hypothetical protein
MNVLSYPILGIGSGHKPITFELPMQVNCKPASPRMTFDFKKANWSKYRQTLDYQLSQWKILMQPQTPEEIEKLTNFITTSLMEATKQAIPETKLITTNVCLSGASKKLIADKHRAYRKWKKHNNNDDKV